MVWWCKITKNDPINLLTMKIFPQIRISQNAASNETDVSFSGRANMEEEYAWPIMRINLRCTFGIHAIPTPTITTTTTRPTISISRSFAWGRNTRHISIVKMVDELLKADERDDIRAAIMTANINPTSPDGKILSTNLKYKTRTVLKLNVFFTRYIKFECKCYFFSINTRRTVIRRFFSDR